MGSKERTLIERLSGEEQESLQRLCRCCCEGQNIPGEHAEKLLRLNLAEMTCGGLGPTSIGRHAAEALQANGNAHPAASPNAH